ncbi:nuclear transport factor 2 family protein [Massilia sp. BSC265]|uniref:nuclear transport factor 2 family protein n=1 Tax=Massilia sp. BSC265 TaxID=1549812 RepID=UPI0004E8B498|nr:nuclear transport factor 2 family protein [Massilia sp. BSC265]KFI05555.1 ketosteroid isomerase [Massilia sp. BSC265]
MRIGLKPSLTKSPFAPAALLLSAALALPAAAGEQGGNVYSDTEKNNKALVQAAFDGWAAGTGRPFDLLADRAEWTIVGKTLASKTYPDKAAFMSEVIQPFNARMSKPLKPVVRGLYADGDTVIVYFDAQGTATDGKPYKNTYTWIMDMEGGKAVRVVAFFDPIEFNDLWTRVRPTASR